MRALHLDTAGIDTAKLDVRMVGPGANRLRGADPRKGERVEQRTEHGSPFSPRCTELAFDPGRYVELLSKGADRRRRDTASLLSASC